MARKRVKSKALNWSEQLGSAIRTRRRALGVTQLRLSALADCGPVFVHQLEKGKPTLRLDKLVAVLHVLGLQLALESGKAAVVVRISSP